MVLLAFCSMILRQYFLSVCFKMAAKAPAITCAFRVARGVRNQKEKAKSIDQLSFKETSWKTAS